MDEKLKLLKEILDSSQNTVALCGVGMLEEGGGIEINTPEKAYEIERRYKVSPEEIFTSAYYNTRPVQFFDFYKKEILMQNVEPTAATHTLAAMEQAGKLQCIITSIIHGMLKRSGCKNVINLRGSIYENRCPRCGRTYPMEYIRDARSVPMCESCGAVIRPLVSLFGEMMDSQLMTRTTEVISKAEVLLLLGTDLEREEFGHYIKYFTGKKMILIHEQKYNFGHNADLIIYDSPEHVLPKLGYS